MLIQNFIPPALEQGLKPLSALNRDAISLSHPYSRMRLLLLEDMERYALSQSFQWIAQLSSQDERRDVALIARVDGRQRAALLSLQQKPPSPCHPLIDHAMLMQETASILAQTLPPCPLRSALEFSIPEYSDLLYRLSNALMLFYHANAQELLAGYTEIMPGRPAIACHRHPYDEIRKPSPSGTLDEDMPLLILLAAETGLMEGLMAAGRDASCPLEKALYLELSLICQQHITQYNSLLPNRSPLENLLLGQYTEGYLYDSFAQDETDETLSAFFSRERDHELSHIQKIAAMIGKANGERPLLPPYPKRLRLHANKGFIRDMLQQIGVTARREQYMPVGALAKGADFFRYQKKMCGAGESLPSHLIIEHMLKETGGDYRFEIAPHPIEALRDRTRDLTDIGR